MKQISPSLNFIFKLAKTQSLLSRRFDGGLGGLGFNELMILHYLNSSPDEKLKRIDLAHKVGLTASGITRQLLPMEKVGYVRKEVNPHDARVSYVILAPGGKEKLHDALERAELLTQEIIPAEKSHKIEEFASLLVSLHGTIT